MHNFVDKWSAKKTQMMLKKSWQMLFYTLIESVLSQGKKWNLIKLVDKSFGWETIELFLFFVSVEKRVNFVDKLPYLSTKSVYEFKIWIK